MGIKDKYKVIPIKKEETKDWLLHKHYAKRMPMAVEYAFGLYSDSLQGVCVFGPTSPTVPVTIFGELGKHKVRELTRLVINENVEKNVLSYFVSVAHMKEFIKKYSVIIKDAAPKFRYLFFIGNKKEKTEMLNDLQLPILQYPKGDNKRYDASYTPNTQGLLFT